MRGVGPKLKTRGSRQPSDAPPADDLDDIFAPDPSSGELPELADEPGAETDFPPQRNASPPSSLRLRRALRRAGATRLLQDGTLPGANRETLEPPPPIPQLEYKPASRKKQTKSKPRRSDWRIGMLAAVAGILWGSGLAYLAYSYLTGDAPLTLTTVTPTSTSSGESTVAKLPETGVAETIQPGEAAPLPLPVSPPDSEAESSKTSQEATIQQPPAEGLAAAPETETAAEPLPLPPPPPPAPATVTESQPAATDIAEVPPEAEAAAQEVTAAPTEPSEGSTAVPETKNQEVALQTPSVGERTTPNTLLDCEGCPTLVSLPAGSFVMGSEASEANHQPDEGPQHSVQFTKPFAISAHEVTFDEWDACVKDGSCKQSPSDEGWGRGKNPVINVSWEDVTTQFLPWLSKKTGHTYRLPTEAEWEYAARASQSGQTMFTFGNDGNSLCTFGNGADASLHQANGGGDGLTCSDGHAQTAAVGSFKPNAFGLYDTHGNVWEWVEDCWNDSYEGAAQDGSARTTGDCTTRVLRGGSWNSDLANLRTAARGWNRSGGRSNGIGFRVVRED